MKRAILATLLLPLCGYVVAYLAAYSGIIDGFIAAALFWLLVGVAILIVPTYLGIRLRRGQPYVIQIAMAFGWVFLLAFAAVVVYFGILGHAYATW